MDDSWHSNCSVNWCRKGEGVWTRTQTVSIWVRKFYSHETKCLLLLSLNILALRGIYIVTQLLMKQFTSTGQRKSAYSIFNLVCVREGICTFAKHIAILRETRQFWHLKNSDISVSNHQHFQQYQSSSMLKKSGKHLYPSNFFPFLGWFRFFSDSTPE